jgi:hypothetical protein
VRISEANIRQIVQKALRESSALESAAAGRLRIPAAEEKRNRAFINMMSAPIERKEKILKWIDEAEDMQFDSGPDGERRLRESIDSVIHDFDFLRQFTNYLAGDLVSFERIMSDDAREVKRELDEIIEMVRRKGEEILRERWGSGDPEGRASKAFARTMAGALETPMTFQDGEYTLLELIDKIVSICEDVRSDIVWSQTGRKEANDQYDVGNLLRHVRKSLDKMLRRGADVSIPDIVKAVVALKDSDRTMSDYVIGVEKSYRYTALSHNTGARLAGDWFEVIVKDWVSEMLKPENLASGFEQVQDGDKTIFIRTNEKDREALEQDTELSNDTFYILERGAAYLRCMSGVSSRIRARAEVRKSRAAAREAEAEQRFQDEKDLFPSPTLASLAGALGVAINELSTRRDYILEDEELADERAYEVIEPSGMFNQSGRLSRFVELVGDKPRLWKRLHDNTGLSNLEMTKIWDDAVKLIHRIGVAENGKTPGGVGRRAMKLLVDYIPGQFALELFELLDSNASATGVAVMDALAAMTEVMQDARIRLNRSGEDTNEYIPLDFDDEA